MVRRTELEDIPVEYHRGTRNRNRHRRNIMIRKKNEKERTCKMHQRGFLNGIHFSGKINFSKKNFIILMSYFINYFLRLSYGRFNYKIYLLN